MWNREVLSLSSLHKVATEIVMQMPLPSLKQSSRKKHRRPEATRKLEDIFNLHVTLGEIHAESHIQQGFSLSSLKSKEHCSSIFSQDSQRYQ